MILLSGCSVHSWYKATYDGISINYKVNKEDFINLNEKVIVISRDERLDKDFFGPGVKPTFFTHLGGYLTFGVFYAFIPSEPTLNKRQDPIIFFKTALTERLSKNGVSVIENKSNEALIFNILVSKLKLDFDSGTWVGEVGYTGVPPCG